MKSLKNLLLATAMLSVAGSPIPSESVRVKSPYSAPKIPLTKKQKQKRAANKAGRKQRKSNKK